MNTYNKTLIDIIDSPVLVTKIPSLGVFSYSSRRQQSILVIISTLCVLEHLYTKFHLNAEKKK